MREAIEAVENSLMEEAMEAEEKKVRGRSAGRTVR